jgi:MoaA/NifB/PqqE/SkfB family radical SAM enzyme
MRKVPWATSARIASRGLRNWFAGRPIVVSFEVADSCTCNCRHCDHGGPRREAGRLLPAEYRRYMAALRPPVVQISGGEPLMRTGVAGIVREVQSGNGLPYTILVSNWSEMTPEQYLELRGAGVDQFSVSLDSPDERHDEFRAFPGLFARLQRLVPRLAALGHDDIVINSCITSRTVGEINRLADTARAWGANICFSAYSARRTGCRDYSLAAPAQIATLNAEFDRIERRRDSTNWIVNSTTTLDATRRFFEDGGMPACRAGYRFLVVTSDGMLQPCSMQSHRFELKDRKRLLDGVTRTNRCDECYVSIRSYLDKSVARLLRENVAGFLAVHHPAARSTARRA